MHVGVLGPLRVADDGGEIPLPGAKERTVLAALAAKVDQVVAPDDLVDALWPDGPPRTATRTLQVYVARLRAALARNGSTEGSVIVTAGRGYRLAIEPMAVDAHRFAILVELGRSALAQGDATDAVDTLSEAFALWRGPAYAGFENSPFGRSEARRLAELRTVAQESMWSARIAAGDARAVIPEVEGYLSGHPLREPAWALLVRAHAAADDQAAALGSIERARVVLADELGVDPGEELRTLQARVLAQDPALRPRTTLPAELVAPPTPFVGRSEELASLQESLSRARGGAARRVLITGDRGSGRWRLACEVAVRAQGQGIPVAVGAEPMRGACLRVVDLRSDPSRPVPELGPRELQLVVAPEQPDGVSFDGEIRVGPLTVGQVRELLAGHARGRVERDTLTAAAEQLHRTSGGNPGAAQGLALGWLRAQVSRRVAEHTRTGSGSAAAHEADRIALAEDVELWSALQPDPISEQGACPWRGLASYTTADAAWFAGRERLTAELVARVAVDRALLLVGASGAGKSSVLQAGLLAALASGALPDSAGWVRILVRPGEHPMRELTRAALAGAAATGPDRVADLLSRSLGGRGEADRVLLVVDQFEECWTVCSDPGERQAFLDALAEIADAQMPVSVVLAVRADHGGSIAGHPGIAAALAGRAVFVGPMVEGELRRAIEGPAARAGLQLDTGLADALVADTLAEPGGLPLLSTALTGLWEQRAGTRLTLAAYAASGGVGAAIARLAEQAYSDLDDGGRAACRVLLRRLAGPGQGEGVVRRRVALDELEALPDPRVRRCVDDLASARLITVSDGHVEVAHEALFRSWPRLREWLAEDATAREVQRRLTLAAADWDRDGRDPALLWTGARLSAAADLVARAPGELTGTEVAFVEASTARLDAERAQAEERARAAQRQNTRLRRLLAGLGITLAVALVAGGLAVVSRNEATAQRETATAQRLAAAALTRPYLADRLLTAVEGVRTQESPQTVGSLLSVLARSSAAVARANHPARWMSMDSAPEIPYAVATTSVEDVFRLDLSTGDREALWSKANANPHDVQLSPDGRHVAFEYADYVRREVPVLVVIDAQSGEVVWSQQPPAEELVNGGFDFTDTPGELAVARRTGLEVHRFDQPDAKPRRIPWETLRSDYVYLHRAFDDHVLLMAAADPQEQPARLVDLASGRITEVQGVGAHGAVSPDGRQVVSQLGEEPGDDVTLVRLDNPGAPPVTLPSQQLLAATAFTPDQSMVLLGTGDGRVEVVDLEGGEVVESLSGHSGLLQGLAVAQDGSTAWSVGRDGDMIGWDLVGARRLAVPGELPTPTHLGSVSADGTLAAVWDRGPPDAPARIVVMDMASREVVAGPFPPMDVKPWTDNAFTGAITPDGRTLVVAMGLAPDNPATMLQLIDVASGTKRAEAELPWWVYGVDVAADGRTVVAAGFEGVAVVDVDSGEVRAQRDLPFADYPEHPSTVAISPDGQQVALARGASVRVVEVATLKDLTSWETEPYDSVFAMEWLPDGRTLAYGGFLGLLGFRAMPQGTPIDQPRDIAAGFIIDLEASPDGSLVASMDTDGQVMLWDARTRQQVGERLPTGGISWGWLAFTPDGAALDAFLERKASVRYDLDTEALIARACALAGREPTPGEWNAMHGDVPQRPTCGELLEGDLLAAR